MNRRGAGGAAHPVMIGFWGCTLSVFIAAQVLGAPKPAPPKPAPPGPQTQPTAPPPPAAPPAKTPPTPPATPTPVPPKTTPPITNPPVATPPVTPPPAPAPPTKTPPVTTPPTTSPPTPTAPTQSQQVQLGRALFVDATLSNPKGVSCASCHDPKAGWTFQESEINQEFGTVPGAVISRFGNRRPPTMAYAALLQSGPPTLDSTLDVYLGGFFYDGRAATLEDQDPSPLQNSNEMNNTPDGVVQAVAAGKNAALFQQTYGVAITTLSTDEAFSDVVQAIVAFEQSPAVSPFSSKYDRYLAGQVQLAPKEMAGLQLFTGSTTGRPGGPPSPRSANCVICHVIPTDPIDGPDLFTASGFLNTGIPKNPNNPYYKQTNAVADPDGYNPLGSAYIDYGLGDYLYPANSLSSGNTGTGSNGQGDYLKINGAFKVPTLRNVDMRPSPAFVKAYGHNGFFKSLQQVVHFYNTRNLTTSPGEVIDFTSANPYAGLKGKPLWPAPENPWPETLVNPTGASDGLVGNLGLTPQQEAALVAFLRTLTD